MEPIFLWWIGDREARPEVLDHVRWHVERAFGVKAVLWEDAARPADTYDPKRKQHLSGKTLKWLLEHAPPGGKVLGITDRDLFIPILTYVFGEAQLGGSVAVASTARLLDGVDLAGPRLLHERLAKEAIHELGHAYGLVHCTTPRCVMGRASGVRDVDGKSHELCSNCKAAVKDPGRRRHVE